MIVRMGLLRTQEIRHLKFLWFVLFFSFSCYERKDNSSQFSREIELECTDSIRFALYNGTQKPIELAMSAQQSAAIGVLKNGEGDTLCTGTMISRSWVITAAHCSTDELKWFVTERIDSNMISSKIIRGVSHAESDVTLLQIQRTEALDELAIVPIPLMEDLDVTKWSGRNATMVGMGRNESGGVDERRFLSEPIVRITERTISVNGEGQSGACDGDSGGPLLVEDHVGDIKLIGVLMGGSKSCLETDLYTRADKVYKWIESTIFSDASNPCGPFNVEGSCVFDDMAVYCDNDKLIDEDCVDGSYCGFNKEIKGYRCVSLETDSCMGINERGTCKGDVAMRCKRGNVFRKDCSVCSQQCIVTLDGQAICGYR